MNLKIIGIDLFWTFLIFLTVIIIYAKYFRLKVFAFILKHLSKKMDQSIHPLKEKLFDDAFKEMYEPGKRLKILELGVGCGTSFSYFPKDSQITLLDKNDIYLPYLKESIKAAKRNDLEIEDLVISKAENMDLIESDSYDAVVATFFLCSVDNPKKVFKEIKRVLKTGGVYIFIDHSIDTQDSTLSRIQKLSAPIWRFFFDNCKFIDIKKTLEEDSSFEKINIFQNKEHKPKSILLKMAEPIFYGYCYKLRNIGVY